MGNVNDITDMKQRVAAAEAKLSAAAQEGQKRKDRLLDRLDTVQKTLANKQRQIHRLEQEQGRTLEEFQQLRKLLHDMQIGPRHLLWRVLHRKSFAARADLIDRLDAIISMMNHDGEAAARKLHRKKEPALAAANWQAIKENLQAEVSGLVSKSILEAIYGAPPVVPPVDQGLLLQVAANRIYADVLYEILSSRVTPPFEPAEEILQWAQGALDDALRDWQGKDCGVADGKFEPPIDAKRSTTEAIFESLRQAAKNEVLQEAAKKRFQV